MDKELTRCTGHCCRNFSLPGTPDELKAQQKTYLETNKKIIQKIASSAERTRETLNILKSDVAVIPEMVIYLGSDNLDCNGNSTVNICHHYTCKNYDTESGNCLIYEFRPRMCSAYPYGHKCQYTGCTRTTDEDKLEIPTKKHEKELVWDEH